ncbi:MAG: hypothetical protein ACKO3T_24330, partial [Planctomycetaceae bacterium]
SAVSRPFSTWFRSTSQTAAQSLKFMAWGPTAFQRSPVPMQPSTGRSFGLRNGAAIEEGANQYGAAAVASDAMLAD